MEVFQFEAVFLSFCPKKPYFAMENIAVSFTSEDFIGIILIWLNFTAIHFKYF